MGQTGGFAASSWLVRQVARSKQEQKSCYLTGMKRIKGIGRYNKTSSFRFNLICVHQVLSVFESISGKSTSNKGAGAATKIRIGIVP